MDKGSKFEWKFFFYVLFILGYWAVMCVGIIHGPMWLAAVFGWALVPLVFFFTFCLSKWSLPNALLMSLMIAILCFCATMTMP